MCFTLCVLLFMANISTSGSLTLTSLQFPSHVMLGQPLSMECSFKKAAGQQIDSIKWYKDGKEFYRLHPEKDRFNSEGQIKQFELEGISIDLNATKLTSENLSGKHTISLVNTNLVSSGLYRCQITESFPPFHTEQQDKNLTIIIQPEKGSPRIKVDRSRVQIGELLKVECSSDRSKPAAELLYFVNGDRVSAKNMEETKKYEEKDGMESSYRLMNLRVRPQHVYESHLKVKCTARIGEAYWQTAEDSVQVIGMENYTEKRSLGTLGGKPSSFFAVMCSTWLVVSRCFFFDS